MTPEEWRNRATEHLDRIHAIEGETYAVDQSGLDAFVDLIRRYELATQALPGIDWHTFYDLTQKLYRAGRKGRPSRTEDYRANHVNWRATRDAETLKSLWRLMNPDVPRKRPPIHPHQLAADYHGIDRQSVDERINRPANRRLDKLAAEKS